MKKILIFKSKGLLLGGALMVGGLISAQVQVNQLDGFGTAIYDINSQGRAVHGNGYYDFATNSSTSTETEVGQTVAITNSDIVLGMIMNANEDYVPASRVDGTWAAYPESAFNPSEEYTIYDISENGMYVVGQTGWTPQNGVWGFIYNTETEVYTLLSSDLYESGAAYAVNNDGIAVGWVDDLEAGTMRMPAYFSEDGSITLIQESDGEASGINNNNVIVGAFGTQGFMYDIAADEFTGFNPPSEYLGLSFTGISENDVIVGYGTYFEPGVGFLRDPFIYSAELGAEAMLISDLLDDLGVDYDAANFEGQAYKISTDGKYIGGWGNGPAFMAMGWAIYLDDLFEDDTIEYCEPALNCTDGDVILNVTFQEINNDTTCSPNGYGDYSDMVASVEAGGTYTMSVTVGDGWFERVSLWIDFDGNGLDEGDFIGEIGDGGQGETLTSEITIPADVATGEYRMRILAMATGSDNPAETDPCINDLDNYGEYEDYTVNVGELGVSDLTSFDFAYYPNPVKDVLNINSQKAVKSVEAFNLTGQKVISSSKVNNSQIDVSSLTIGTYVFKITLEGGQIETFKIVKK
jgi:hypothetical protein